MLTNFSTYIELRARVLAHATEEVAIHLLLAIEALFSL
jgi:hypothetical protein